MSDTKRVAIACQGGGSHAAFTAGVLLELLEPANFGRFDLVGLSGTSGGAVCAALAWAGLVRGGGPAAASAALAGFWEELSAHDPLDAAVNFWSVALARLPFSWEVSPYAIYAPAEARMRELLGKYLVPATAPVPEGAPEIFLGATDILNGGGLAFDGAALGIDQIIASAAVPPLFRAVTAADSAGVKHLCWDGLFARNPPIREFTDLRPAPPDEIWLVRINPAETAHEPVTMPDIIDRRNELSGNLSLDQEIFFIEKINELRAAHPTLALKYKHIEIRQIELRLDLDYPSKLDRDARHIRRLIATGRDQAPGFFEEATKGKLMVEALIEPARKTA